VHDEVDRHLPGYGVVRTHRVRPQESEVDGAVVEHAVLHDRQHRLVLSLRGEQHAEVLVTDSGRLEGGESRPAEHDSPKRRREVLGADDDGAIYAHLQLRQRCHEVKASSTTSRKAICPLGEP
jgi:hypothetical protein